MSAADMWSEVAEVELERWRAPVTTTMGRVPVSHRIEQAAAFMCVSCSDITGRGRSKSVARARHMACWLLRQDGWSYPEIGRHLDRDHNSVMNGLRRVEAMQAAEPGLAESMAKMVGE